MNVTAFSLIFYQHDIVPWCSHSQHLDLICALLHNLLQEDLGSNSAKSLQMRKVIPNTAYRPEPFIASKQRCQSTGQHHPSWQNCMEIVAISKLHLTSEAMLDFSVLQWIQMDKRERNKGLAENPAAASELAFSRSIHFKIFSINREKGKPHPSTLSLKTSSCKIILKGIYCLLKEETHSQPILLHCLLNSRLPHSNEQSFIMIPLDSVREGLNSKGGFCSMDICFLVPESTITNSFHIHQWTAVRVQQLSALINLN